MPNPIGRLVSADETFNHQIVDTFAVVSQSDPAWTEKVCAMAAKKDGSLQLGFGLGKYTNRNVMDGYGALSRGVEQLTVRASRRLSSEPELTVMGPVRYEVLEPMKRVRFALDANDVNPLSFEWEFEAALPPVLEERTHRRSPSGFRVEAELVRYHQMGRASGWIDLDGERTEITSDDWVSTRDHSWGVRYDVGVPPNDTEPAADRDGISILVFWSPTLLERPDGSTYGLWFHLIQAEAPGFLHKDVLGGFEHPDGRIETIVDIDAHVGFDPVTRRLRSGPIHFTMADGSARTIQLDVPTDTGFHLGAGHYFGYKDHYHGEWRGDLVVDGERIADCTQAPHARELLHQLRDTVVRISDPDGGGSGWGNCQPMAIGPFDRFGLDAETSFM